MLVSGRSGGRRQSFVTAISHSASVMTRLEAQMISSTGVTVAGVTNARRRIGGTELGGWKRSKNEE